MADVAAGLLEGLNRGIGAFAEARDRRDSRATEMAAKGLIQDESGKWVADPIFAASESKKRQADYRAKAALEGRVPKFDDSGELTEAPRSPDELAYLKAKDASNPMRGILAKMQVEAAGRKRDEDARQKTEEENALKTPYGQALTKDDAKSVKDADQARIEFDGTIQKMISLREQYGAEKWNQGAVAEGKQLSKQALLQLKNLEKLGQISGSDMEIVNDIIPQDPLEVSGGNLPMGIKVPGLGDPTMKRLKNLRTTAAEKLKSGISGRMVDPSGATGLLDKELSGLNAPAGPTAGNLIQPAAVADQYAPDVLAYAKQHRITPEQAQQIKIQRGGQ